MPYHFRARQTWVLILALPPTSSWSSVWPQKSHFTILSLNFSFVNGVRIPLCRVLVNIRDKTHKVLGTQSPSKMVAINVISLIQDVYYLPNSVYFLTTCVGGQESLCADKAVLCVFTQCVNTVFDTTETQMKSGRRWQLWGLNPGITCSSCTGLGSWLIVQTLLERVFRWSICSSQDLICSL